MGARIRWESEFRAQNFYPQMHCGTAIALRGRNVSDSKARTFSRSEVSLSAIAIQIIENRVGGRIARSRRSAIFTTRGAERERGQLPMLHQSEQRRIPQQVLQI